LYSPIQYNFTAQHNKFTVQHNVYYVNLITRQSKIKTATCFGFFIKPFSIGYYILYTIDNVSENTRPRSYYY